MARGEAHPPLVGREEELARLDAALAGRAERPGLFLSGEAGIGKTRLVTEFAERARRAGATVVSGGCLELGADVLPLAPFVEALGRLYETLGDRADEAVGAGRPDLAAILPELGPSPPAEPDRIRLFEGVRGFLERSPDPLLFVLEDVHWADRSSLELLAYLVRRLRHGRTLVLATFRSDEVTIEHPLAPVVAELTHSGKAVRLELPRLLSAEIEELIHGLRADVAPAEVALVVAQAEGNPLYAEELVAQGPMSGAAMPSTLRELLLVRIRGLGNEARRVLALAAIAGRPVPHAFLAAAWEGPSVDLGRGLREALGRGVLVQEPAPSRLAFRHALFGSAIEEDLLPGERVALHARLATLLLERPDLAASTEAGAAAEIAGHWYAAERYPEALETSVRAAEAAERVPAYAEAHALYERALELWPQVEGARVILPLDHVMLLEHAADAATSSGTRARGVELLRQAIEAVDPAADPWRAGDLHRRLGWDLYEADGWPAAEPAFDAALRLIPTEPPSLERGRVMADHGYSLSVAGRLEEAEPLLEEALELARRMGGAGSAGRAVECWAKAGLAQCRWLRSDYLGSLELLDSARRAALESELPLEISMLSLNEAGTLSDVARFEEAIALASRAREQLRSMGLGLRYGDNLAYYVAYAQLELGRWSAAERTLAKALDAAPKPRIRVWTLGVRALLRARQGRVAEARRDCDENRALLAAGATGLKPDVDAEIAVALLEGRWTAVRSILEPLVAASPDPEDTPRYLDGLQAEAEEALEARRRHDAERVARAIEVALEYAARIRTLLAAGEAFPAGASPLVRADAAQAEAELSRVEGRSAPDLWARAAELREAIGMPYELAYIRLRQAEALLRSGGARSEAAAHLREAHGITCELGAAPLRQEIEALARRARIDLEKTPASKVEMPVRPADSSGLSVREREVLALLVEGRTNREIGEALFISEKTASVHVTHILDKLGVTSRGAAAAAAVRDGLVPGSLRS